MSYYTTNLCLNPSFQNGTAGYSVTLSAVMTLDTTRTIFGAAQSLRVDTPGNFPGEGCVTASGLITTTSYCSASLYVQGQGSVIVSANVNPGGMVVGTVPITLENNIYQRVVINNIACTPGQTLFLTVSTSGIAQATSFWISAIQVEPESPAHPYCDGDQPGCAWLSGGTSGISVRPYQFASTGTGVAIATGNIVPVIGANQVSFSVVAGTAKALGNKVLPTVSNPVAAFDDFGIFKLTDPDPAQTYAGVNNALSSSGTGATYNRIFSSFYPPLDYPVSGGTLLWPRAAYMALGFQFGNVPATGTQNISDVQAEILPMTSSAPSAYSLPRQVNTIIKPNRLNFCVNPSMESGTANWSAIGTASLAQDATVFLPNVTVYDDVQTSSLHSMKVTLNAAGDGTQITISNLIVGLDYTVSAYIQPGPGLANISVSCGSGTGSLANISGTAYGSGPYGSGPYGGVTLTGTDLTTGIWYRPGFTFTATASSHVLIVSFLPGSDIAYPANFWIDAVLVELGDSVETYFDGNFGRNYFWEGTANLSRSYFYDQFSLKQQAVLNVLEKHVPLGISFSTPVYKVPYTQD